MKDDLSKVILFQIDQTSRVAKQHSQRAFDRLKLNITVDQWVLLKIIEQDNELSQVELAKKALRDPASITRTLDILEKKELAIRMPIPDNRRQYTISLTTKGQDFIAKNMSLVKAHREKSTAGFTRKELITLQNMLLRIQQNMQ